MQHASKHLMDIGFDSWVLRRRSGELLLDGTAVPLQEQPLRILEALLATPGELVTRKQLIELLWPTGIVEFDASLNTAVRKLRAALGDDSERPRYVETVPRRGYRFIGRVHEPHAQHWVEERPSASASPKVEQARGLRWRAAGLTAGFLLVAAAALTWVWSLGFVRGAQGVTAPSRDEAQTRAPALGTDSAPITTNAVAFDLYLRAKDRISQIMPIQPELPRGSAPPHGGRHWIGSTRRCGSILRSRTPTCCARG